MQSEQFQLHADIEQRHWWFVARRQIMRRLLERVLPSDASRRSQGGTAGLPSSADSRPDAEVAIEQTAYTAGQASSGTREVNGAAPLVVDVGCGTGGNIAALAGQCQCVGIDASPEAVAFAQQRFPGVRFLVGYAPDDLGELASRADALLLMDVLEHVPDDFLVLSRLLAACRPGSHVLVTVPADDALWSQHDESFGHYRRYDRPRLERLWEGLPVKARLVSYFNTRLYWLIRAIRWRNQRRRSAAGTAGTDFWLPHPAVNTILTGIFAGEGPRLERWIDQTGTPYRRGASLVAILRREEGSLVERSKPDGLALDRR